MNDEKEYVEIDFARLFRVLLSKLWLIILSALLVSGLTLGYTMFFVTPTYQANILLFVNNSSLSINGQSLSISAGEISAAKNLVETYRVILESRLTLEAVIKEADLDCTYGQLKAMISSEPENNTEIFRVSVVNEDPKMAMEIANTIAKVLPEKISYVVEGSSVKEVDMAVEPTSRHSPSYTKNTVIGFIVGALISCIIVVVIDLTNDRITSDEWIIQTYGDKIPLFSVVPDSSFKGTNKYYKKYY